VGRGRGGGRIGISDIDSIPDILLFVYRDSGVPDSDIGMFANDNQVSE
jgi:hypothetical protein